ncbi:MAG: hypothetical protein QGG34_07005 [SAR202 cluster bacterium]|nr:hypothetical protein [SAR202 cluster bacterium]MDP6302423.1 hypothetical protein [SAR202 cluster bacterium]MDP7103060.1 hypothetical protein [SAR202 cluster bacterium]MDP7224574.1 hypothetical protein [SAR202 cluster bacterium]MDP7413912.1 hypothetical protein [SAR202 cluster bacterium]
MMHDMKKMMEAMMPSMAESCCSGTNSRPSSAKMLNMMAGCGPMASPGAEHPMPDMFKSMFESTKKEPVPRVL